MDGKIHTARELALQSEVSTKTIQRGILALESAGVFTESIKGKTGGYKLSKTSIPHLSSLTPRELGELMSICKFKESILPASTRLTFVKEALINSTPVSETGKVISAQSKIVLDSLPWGNQNINLGDIDNIYYACENNLTLEFDYTKQNDEQTHRIIEPYCLCFKDGSWYTYASDVQSSQMKLFKLSRMNNITITNQTFKPDPSVNVYSMPWNNFEGADEITLTLEIKNSSLAETREWLDIKTINVTPTSTIASATVKNSMGLYYKLLTSSKSIKILSPESAIENLLGLCKSVEKIYV